MNASQEETEKGPGEAKPRGSSTERQSGWGFSWDRVRAGRPEVPEDGDASCWAPGGHTCGAPGCPGRDESTEQPFRCDCPCHSIPLSEAERTFREEMLSNASDPAKAYQYREEMVRLLLPKVMVYTHTFLWGTPTDGEEATAWVGDNLSALLVRISPAVLLDAVLGLIDLDVLLESHAFDFEDHEGLTSHETERAPDLAAEELTQEMLH